MHINYVISQLNNIAFAQFLDKMLVSQLADCPPGLDINSIISSMIQPVWFNFSKASRVRPCRDLLGVTVTAIVEDFLATSWSFLTSSPEASSLIPLLEQYHHSWSYDPEKPTNLSLLISHPFLTMLDCACILQIPPDLFADPP
jgi:hypothetical protein